MPGQLGPTMRDLFCDLSMSVMRTMSGGVSLSGLHSSCHCGLYTPCWGIPSVMVTIRGTSAAIASSMLFAATGGLRGSQLWWSPPSIMRADVRNENGGSGGSSLLDSVCYAGKDGLAEMF
jgi:hypothetical protein